MKRNISYGIFGSTAVAAGILLTMAACSGGGGSGTSASSEDTFPVTVNARFEPGAGTGTEPNFKVKGVYSATCENSKSWSFSGVIDRATNVLTDIQVDNLQVPINRQSCRLIVTGIERDALIYEVDNFTILGEYSETPAEAVISYELFAEEAFSANVRLLKSDFPRVYFNAFINPLDASSAPKLTFVYGFDITKIPVKTSAIPVNGSVNYPITDDDITNTFVTPPNFNATLAAPSSIINLALDSWTIESIFGGFEFSATSPADDYIRVRIDVDTDAYVLALADMKKAKLALLNKTTALRDLEITKQVEKQTILNDALYNNQNSQYYIDPAPYQDENGEFTDVDGYNNAIINFVNSTQSDIDALTLSIDNANDQIASINLNPTAAELIGLRRDYLTEDTPLGFCFPGVLPRPYVVAQEIFSYAADNDPDLIVGLSGAEKTAFSAPFAFDASNVHSLNYEVGSSILDAPKDATYWLYVFRKKGTTSNLVDSYSVFCASVFGDGAGIVD